MSPTATSKKSESRSLIAGYLRLSWSLSGSEPAVVRLQSVLDFVGSDALDRVLAGILNSGYRQIVLDLGPLERITVAGAEGLLKSASEARRMSARLVLAAPSAAVREFLEKLGIFKELEVFESVEAAVKAAEPA